MSAIKTGSGRYEGGNDEKNKTFIKLSLVTQDEISRPHYHNSVEINVVLKGRMRCVVDGKTYDASENEIFYFDSLGVHYFDTKKGSEVLCVVVDTHLLNDFYSVYRNETKKAGFAIYLNDKEKNEKIIALLQEWLQCYQECNFLQTKGYVTLLFGSLAQAYPVYYGEEPRNKVFALDILHFLEDHFKEKITLEMVAQHFGYSKTSISRIFHSVIGQDIRSYVNMLRAEHVYQLLSANPRITVLEAAYASGFENTSSFYRAYNSRFNELPKRK